MAKAKNDFVYLQKWIASLKFYHYAGFAVAVAGLYFLMSVSNGDSSKADRTDPKSVAEEFVRESRTIATYIGDVKTIKSLGSGNSTGKSYIIAYSVRGDKSGYCHVTLTKNKEKLWFVKSGTLQTNGKEYNLPVMRKEETKKTKSLFNQ